jgi:hypothetical protein
MDGACITHGELRIAHKISVRKPEEKETTC